VRHWPETSRATAEWGAVSSQAISGARAADAEEDQAPRRALSRKQRATVEALLDATLELLRERGYEQLTIRSAAERAGVTHTTAYTYFSSKEHLVVEVFWRGLRLVPHEPADLDKPMSVRVTDALRGPGLLVADEPALAEASLSAMLARDADVARVRGKIGGDFVARIQGSLGPDQTPELVEALSIGFSGAMLQAGMGYFTFPGVVDRIASLASMLETGALSGRS
jgi:AcrR family transcriptional regulator